MDESQTLKKFPLHHVFNSLNEHQLAAVNQTEGPVLVLAGPGTGKTQILSARIVNILAKKEIQVAPENILCLTYTEAGATAMRNRLLTFIGTNALKVNIQTFHSFCMDIMRKNPGTFSSDDATLISPVEEIQYIHEILDGLEKEHPLKKFTGDVYSDTRRILELFRQMKREGWDENFIQQHADLYLNDIKEKPEDYPEFYYKRKTKLYNAGDIKMASYEKLTERMNVLKGAAGLFSKYGKIMLEANKIDYDDMILNVLSQLKKNEILRNSLQEKYLYIMVDEFQDTNETQNDIILELCRHWGDESNIFVVGDDDQSIYRFQGANIENISKFISIYKNKLSCIVLSENYRSTSPVLSASGQLISANHERVVNLMPGVTKNLTAVRDIKNASPVKLISCYDSATECIFITQKIKEYIKNGIDPSDIGVLYRNNRQAEELSVFMSRHKIPFLLKRRSNVLHEPIIQKIVELIEYIVNESENPYSADDLLFKILHFDFINPSEITLPDRILLDIRLKSNSENFISLRKYIEDNNISENLNSLVSKLGKLIQYAHSVSPEQFFTHLIAETGLGKYLIDHDYSLYEVELVRTFYDKLYEFTSGKAGKNLRAFTQEISLMNKYGVSLPAEKISGSDNGVQLTTIHSSKGLEYKIVFMMGNQKTEWGNNRNRQFVLPDNIYTRISQGENDEEERRLFYVGMTRTKDDLYISWGNHNKQGDEVEPCLFIRELQESGKTEEIDFHASDQDISDFHISVMSGEFTFPTYKEKHPFTDTYIDNMQLSSTQLSSYLNCPRGFYYDYVLRVPVSKSPSLIFGSAIHAAYEFLFKNSKESKKTVEMDLIINQFLANMKRDGSVLSSNEINRLLTYGEKIITEHVNHFSATWNFNVETEVKLNRLIENKIPITGLIDKIEIENGYIYVIDYKTGKFTNARNKLKGPQYENSDSDKSITKLYGGDYWRQAVFYKLLIEGDERWGRNYIFKEAVFDFIEPHPETGEYIKYPIHINKDDEKFVSDLIVKVYNSIRNKQFENGCGDCFWCNMLR